MRPPKKRAGHGGTENADCRQGHDIRKSRAEIRPVAESFHAKVEAEYNQQDECGNFGDSKDVLKKSAGFHFSEIVERQQYDDAHCQELLGIDREVAHREHQSFWTDFRKEHTGEFCEGDTYCCYGSRLNNGKQGPAIEEPVQWSERFFKVDVLPAGLRHGCSQLAVTEGAQDGDDSRDRPGQE